MKEARTVFPEVGALRVKCYRCESLAGQLEEVCRVCGGIGSTPVALVPYPACPIHGVSGFVSIRAIGLPCPECLAEERTPAGAMIRKRAAAVESVGTYDFRVASEEYDLTCYLFLEESPLPSDWPTFRFEPVDFRYGFAFDQTVEKGALRYTQLQVRPMRWVIGHGAESTPSEWGVALTWSEKL